MNNSNLVKRRSFASRVRSSGLAAAFSVPLTQLKLNGFDEVHDIVIVGSGFVD